jgi:hypothetical protein
VSGMDDEELPPYESVDVLGEDAQRSGSGYEVGDYVREMIMD